MPRATYRQWDGTEATVEIACGDSLMDGALDHGLPGIIGQCGGGCTCVTCHCYVAAEWRDRLPAVRADEAELLAFAIDPGPGSRLACQILMTDELDGIRVQLPQRQL
ncbi:MAG: 2Fe-2S iron-sulfur cluster-binding protein [Pseudomonadales bacterium]|nr:(2Fe-2S)-binding protein [Pseudomonadales bacterium]